VLVIQHPIITDRKHRDTMKRKAEDNIEPATAAPESEQSDQHPKEQQQHPEPTPAPAAAEATFTDLGLDPRLVQAIAKQNFNKPTLVQRTAIPLALDGQDVLAKAKTGSGKTLAYILPVLQSILKRKQVRATLRGNH
jgi:ATP-dependent RNA helicase DDX56/DBP9